MKKTFLMKAKTKIPKDLIFKPKVINFKNRLKWWEENHFGIFNKNSARLKNMIQLNSIEIVLVIKMFKEKIMCFRKK